MSITDNTNVRWLKIFHLYKGFFRKVGSSGTFIKGAAKVVEPPRIEYKGFKFKFNKKGDVCRGLIVRTSYLNKYQDGTVVFFRTNDLVLIKKKQDPKSKYIYGPVTKHIRRKKFIALFKSKV
jgi:ribosomal protein L14